MNFKVNIEVCRVCMKSEEGYSLYRDLDLQSKFVFTTRLSLKPDDSMPTIICSKCVVRLKIAYDFVQLAHASEKNLKAFLSRISNDFQEVTKAGGSMNCSPLIGVDDEDDILALFEDSAEKDSSGKQQIREQQLNAKSRPTPRKLTPATSIHQPYAPVSKMKLEQVEKQRKPPFKEEISELLTEEEDIVYYEEANFLDENDMEENDQKRVSGGDWINNDTSIEEQSETSDPVNPTRLTESTSAEQQQMNGYMEELNSMSPEQDAGCSYNENLSTQYTFENAHERDQDDGEMELEIEMDSRPITSTTSTAVDEGFQVYEDTEELASEVDENLIVSDANDHNEVKNYLQITVDSAEMEPLPADDDLPPNQTITANLSGAVRKEKQPRQTSPLKQTRMNSAEGAPILAESPLLTGAPSTESAQMLQNTRRLGKSSTSSARYICLKCNRDFSTKTNLTRHLTTHEGAKPYECTLCQKRFSQNGSLKQHMYVHTGEKPFICEVCTRGFSQCKSLVFHMRRHTGEKPFPCAHCGSSFRQKDGLKTHILKHHMIHHTDGEIETHTCDICKKLLATRYALKVHMKKHINSICIADSHSSSHSVASETDLINLLSDDDLVGDKAFISEELALNIEDVTSSTQILDTMTANTSKASRVKKYQCRKCYKCFAIKKSLLRHLTSHGINASKLFQCQICQVAFDTSPALHEHRTHEHGETGICSQTCDVCSMTFANLTELNDHISEAHNSTDHNCPVCPDLHFESQKQLLEHLMEHENINNDDDSACNEV